jgi:hypothetical protein
MVPVLRDLPRLALRSLPLELDAALASGFGNSESGELVTL